MGQVHRFQGSWRVFVVSDGTVIAYRSCNESSLGSKESFKSKMERKIEQVFIHTVPDMGAGL